jgi:hypothetical protein
MNKKREYLKDKIDELATNRTRTLVTCIGDTRVEAGSNTSTVTLRVVRGDEMGLKKAAT